MNQIVLPFVELIVTTKCNLQCMDCSNLIPLYRNAMCDVALADVIKSIDALLDSVSELTYLKIHGGEPLLSANIKSILHNANKREKIKNIIVPTNGSYIPKESVLSVLGQYAPKTKMVISNYESCRDIHQKLIAACQRHNVNYSISKEKSWYSFGPVQPYGKTEKDLQEQYDRCEMKRFPAMYAGKLYPCARIAHGIYLGLISAVPDWDFDLVNTCAEDRPNLVERFLSLQLHPACDYCTMDNVRSRKSGEQP